ncbi:MAG TPA: hypothetical protein DCQ06_06315, partial [Myxococcales bacterium]|nr:hypothetical protein [Myxococcales bacterium]
MCLYPSSLSHRALARLSPTGQRYVLMSALWMSLMVLASPPCWAAEQPRFGEATLDFFQGTVSRCSRVTGLGGSYVSIAEGADAHLLNPASFALRARAAGDQWFDFDLTLNTDLLVGSDNDLDLSGLGHAGNQVELVQFGFNLKFGQLGVGIHGQNRTYEFSQGQTVSSWYGGIGAAWSWGQGAWAVGVLLVNPQATVSTRIDDEKGGSKLHTAQFGGGFELGTFGVRWAPIGRRFRFGASLRLPSTLQTDSTSNSSKGLAGLSL